MNMQLRSGIYSQANSGSVMTNVFSRRRAPVTDVMGDWRSAVLDRLEELIRLNVGWDGYDGLPVSLENATFALRMLEVTCREDTIAPQIVPGPSGELQIEWHTEFGDIELLVRGPYSVHAWRHLPSLSADGEEQELTNDFLLVARWIEELWELNIVISAAA